MDACNTTVVDPQSPYPHALPHLGVGEVEILSWDTEDAIDCRGLGVTLSTLTWDIHPDDDDGNVTITPLPAVGYVGYVQVAAGPGSEGKSYRILGTATASDGNIVKVYFEFPVVDTSLLKYAA